MAKRKVSTPAPQRSKPKPKSGGGEASTALIFFLVFSVLLNLGLGVATYFGFQHDDAIKVANVDLNKQVKNLTDDREWYQFQALAYRAYMGQLKDPKDFGILSDKREKFDRKQLGVQAKDKDDVYALILTTLEKDRNLKTNAEAKQNYESVLDAERKKSADLVVQVAQLRTDKDKAESKKKLAEDELATEIDNNKKELVKLQKDANVKLDEYFKTVELSNKQRDDQNKLDSAKLGTQDAEKNKLEKQITVLQGTIAGLKQLVTNRDLQITQLEKNLGKDAPTEIKLDWKIVSIDKNGTTAYINLGSADKLTSGLTFRVHGIGEDGRPKPRDKANVEVLNVVNDHLSQVRIQYDYDERKGLAVQRHNPRLDPVLKGDVLYNPTWDPFQKRHIAIAGPIDLVGDGRDSLPEFVRTLERQNVVVDAYLDTKDFAIKGPGLTVNTDLLIIAPLPRSLNEARGADAEMKTKLLEGVAKMRKQADENGVKRKGLRQYLEEIGYRVPKGLADDGTESTTTRPAAVDVPPPPPVVKPDVPPVKPDVPMKDK